MVPLFLFLYWCFICQLWLKCQLRKVILECHPWSPHPLVTVAPWWAIEPQALQPLGTTVLKYYTPWLYTHCSLTHYTPNALHLSC